MPPVSKIRKACFVVKLSRKRQQAVLDSLENEPTPPIRRVDIPSRGFVDHGEPWTLDEGRALDRFGETPTSRQRAIDCVNALAGVIDPVSWVRHARGALAYVHAHKTKTTKRDRSDVKRVASRGAASERVRRKATGR